MLFIAFIPPNMKPHQCYWVKHLLAILQGVLNDIALACDAKMHQSDQRLESIDIADSIAEVATYGMQTFLGDGFMVGIVILHKCMSSSCRKLF